MVEHGILMALGAEKLAVSVLNTGAEEGKKALYPQKMAWLRLERPEMDPEE